MYNYIFDFELVCISVFCVVHTVILFHFLRKIWSFFNQLRKRLLYLYRWLKKHRLKRKKEVRVTMTTPPPPRKKRSKPMTWISPMPPLMVCSRVLHVFSSNVKMNYSKKIEFKELGFQVFLECRQLWMLEN